MPILSAGANIRLDSLSLNLEYLFTAGEVVQRTSNLIRVQSALGSFTDFLGSFFYSGTGDLIGGAFTGAVNVSSYSTTYVIAGSSVGVLDFYKALALPDLDATTLFLSGPKLVQFRGSNQSDILYARDPRANHFLDGQGGADLMKGGSGSDRYVVDSSADRVIDTPSGGVDVVYAKTSYVLKREAGAIDVLKAITATATNPINLYGNDYTNTVVGNNGRNYLRGYAGNDKLFGHGGDDVLIGGTGWDQLIGGAGRDIFAFDSGFFQFINGNKYTTYDVIRDFTIGEDKIRLDRSIFTALKPGALEATDFLDNYSYTHGGNNLWNEHIRYNNNSGTIWYDPDGTGPQIAFKFAKVSAALPLTHADFFVV